MRFLKIEQIKVGICKNLSSGMDLYLTGFVNLKFFENTVKLGFSDHREKRPPASNDGFFVHGQFHTETAL